MGRHARQHIKALECAGKVRYDTFQLAEKCAVNVRRRRNGKLTVYPCKFCHGYHIGNTVKVRRPRPIGSD